jgi:hypothetical protein
MFEERKRIDAVVITDGVEHTQIKGETSSIKE